MYDFNNYGLIRTESFSSLSRPYMLHTYGQSTVDGYDLPFKKTFECYNLNSLAFHFQTDSKQEALFTLSFDSLSKNPLILGTNAFYKGGDLFLS